LQSWLRSTRRERKRHCQIFEKGGTNVQKGG
jgi:hypothetical protein